MQIWEIRKKEAEMRRISFEKGREEANRRREMAKISLEKNRKYMQMLQSDAFNSYSASFEIGNTHIMMNASNIGAMQSAFSTMF